VRATKVNAGLAESNGRLLLGIWRDSLHVTCGLTACTPGSATGPTLGNEYGKTLPLPLQLKCGYTLTYLLTLSTTRVIDKILESTRAVKSSIRTPLHIGRHLEFIIEQGHRVNWVSGSLDSRVTGSLGHKM